MESVFVLNITHWPPTMSEICDAFAAIEKHIQRVQSLTMSAETHGSIDYVKEAEPDSLWGATIHLEGSSRSISFLGEANHSHETPCLAEIHFAPSN
jgi:hypothetical protein